MKQENPKPDQKTGIELRCLECMIRVQVTPEAKEFTCPNCGTRFLVYWPAPDIAKIKGVAQHREPHS